jgi:hypothetical protein
VRFVLLSNRVTKLTIQHHEQGLFVLLSGNIITSLFLSLTGCLCLTAPHKIIGPFPQQLSIRLLPSRFQLSSVGPYPTTTFGPPEVCHMSTYCRSTFVAVPVPPCHLASEQILLSSLPSSPLRTPTIYSLPYS